MRVIGLDLSTSCCGYCILETDDLSIVELGHISLKKIEGLFQKVDYTVPLIAAKILGMNISKCCIEEPVAAFTPGMSSAHVVILLAKFNALISYHVRNQVGDANISFVKPGEARRSCGLVMTTKSKSGGLSQKQQVYSQLTASNGLLSKITFPQTKTGNPRPENFDEADAFVVAMYGAIQSK